MVILLAASPTAYNPKKVIDHVLWHQLGSLRAAIKRFQCLCSRVRCRIRVLESINSLKLWCWCQCPMGELKPTPCPCLSRCYITLGRYWAPVNPPGCICWGSLIAVYTACGCVPIAPTAGAVSVWPSHSCVLWCNGTFCSIPVTTIETCLCC